MLGPINAYQIQQQSVQSTQVRNPHAQPFLAQEQNTSRSERLNETRRADEPLTHSNKSNTKNQRDISTEETDSLASQSGKGGGRGSLVDLLA